MLLKNSLFFMNIIDQIDLINLFVFVTIFFLLVLQSVVMN
jgi:hypothetical protein